MTPLLVCCTSGRTDFADVLIERGANENVRDGKGHSAYQTAHFYGHEALAKRFHDGSEKAHYHA